MLWLLAACLLQVACAAFWGITPEPTTRTYCKIVHVPAVDSLLLFGGNAAGYIVADIDVYSLKRQQWLSPVVAGDHPPASIEYQALLHPARPDVVWFFGGRFGCQASAQTVDLRRLDALWEFNATSFAWRKLDAAGAAPQASHSSIAFWERGGQEPALLVAGGYGDDFVSRHQIHMYADGVWQLVATSSKEFIGAMAMVEADHFLARGSDGLWVVVDLVAGAEVTGRVTETGDSPGVNRGPMVSAVAPHLYMVSFGCASFNSDFFDSCNNILEHHHLVEFTFNTTTSMFHVHWELVTTTPTPNLVSSAREPTPTYLGSSTVDSSTGTVYFTSGLNDNINPNPVFAMVPVGGDARSRNWTTHLAPSVFAEPGAAPPPVYNAASAVWEAESLIFLQGGCAVTPLKLEIFVCSGDSIDSPLHVFNITSLSWVEFPTTESWPVYWPADARWTLPSPRHGGTMTISGDKLFLYGGFLDMVGLVGGDFGEAARLSAFIEVLDLRTREWHVEAIAPCNLILIMLTSSFASCGFEVSTRPEVRPFANAWLAQSPAHAVVPHPAGDGRPGLLVMFGGMTVWKEPDFHTYGFSTWDAVDVLDLSTNPVSRVRLYGRDEASREEAEPPPGDWPAASVHAAMAWSDVVSLEEGHPVLFLFGGLNTQTGSVLSVMWKLHLDIEMSGNSVTAVEPRFDSLLQAISCTPTGEELDVGIGAYFGAMVGHRFVFLSGAPEVSGAVLGFSVYDVETNTVEVFSQVDNANFFGFVAVVTGVVFDARIFLFGGVQMTEDNSPSGLRDTSFPAVLWPGLYARRVSNQGDNRLCEVDEKVPCASLAHGVQHFSRGAGNGAFVPSSVRPEFIVEDFQTVDSLVLAKPVTIAGVGDTPALNCAPSVGRCVSITPAAADADLPTIISNVAIAGGGIDAVRATVWLHNVSIADSVSTSGAALHASSSNVSLTNCLFAHNTASVSGGAMFLSSSEAHLDHVTLTGNMAGTTGGALYSEFSTLTATECLFTGNTATGETLRTASGGAVFAIGQRVSLTGSTLSNNAVGDVPLASGGALYATSASVDVTNTLVSHNWAVVGGGMAFGDRCIVGVANSTLAHNTASARGGGTAATTAESLTFEGVVLSNNMATDGGGAVVEDSLASTWDRCAFVGNTASGGDGGAIAVDSSPLVATAASFVGNAASGGGACVFWDGAVRPVVDPEPPPCDGACNAADNCAVYGCGEATAVRSVVAVTNSTPAAPPGSALPPIAVHLLDAGGAIIKADSESTVRATVSPGQVSGGVRVANAGVALFDELVVSGVSVAGDVVVHFTAGDLTTTTIVTMQACPPGSHLLDGACAQCPVGHFSETGASCTPCPPGEVSTAPGADACVACGDGYEARSAAEPCVACPAGAARGSGDGVVCVACGPAEVAPLPAMPSCRPCGDGEYAVSAQEPCAPCPPATARNASTQAECTPCPAGTAASLPGQTVCSDCLPGFQQPSRNEALCEACTPGLIAPSNRTTTCDSCPPGTYSPAFAATACTQCDVGYDQPSFGQAQCVACAPGRFSGAGATSCDACPFGTDCDNGVLALQAGYWSHQASQVANVTASTAFVPCPVTDVCVLVDGGVALGCSAGYTGELCSVCEDDFAKVGGVCVRCPPPAVNMLLLFLVVLVVVGAVTIMVRRASQKRSQASIVLRILLNFLQLSATLMAVELGPEGGVRELLGLSAGASLSFDFPPLACTLQLSFYEQLAGYVLLPLVAVLLPAAVFGAKHCLASKTPATRRLLRARHFGMWVSTVVFLLFLVLQRVSRALFDTFHVYGHRVVGETRLHSHITVATDSAKYRVAAVVSILGILMYSVGIPVMGLVLVLRHRNDMEDEAVRGRYAFITDGYIGPMCWFEVCVIARKLLAGALLSFVQSSFYQVVGSLALVTSALWIQTALMPYSSPFLNWLEVLSLGTSFGIQLCSLVLWHEETSSAAVGTAIALFVLFVGLCVVAAAYLVWASRRAGKAAAEGDPAQPLPSHLNRRRLLSWVPATGATPPPDGRSRRSVVRSLSPKVDMVGNPLLRRLSTNRVGMTPNVARRSVVRHKATPS